MKFCCIYKIESKVDPDKIYIGSTYWFQHRKWRHKHSLKIGTHVNNKLLRHAAKYGIEDLVFSVVEVVESKEKLKDAEQKYLDLLSPWFNLQPTAYNNRGFKHTETSKKKIGSKNKGKKLSEETKRKISEANTGKKKSKEERERMSLYRKGRKRPPFSEEWRRNLSLAHIGKDSNTKGWETRKRKTLNSQPYV